MDEFKLKVQGISTTADMSRDQMANTVFSAPKGAPTKPGAQTARPAAPAAKPAAAAAKEGPRNHAISGDNGMWPTPTSLR